MGKICAFFGHRSVYGDIAQELERQIEKLIIQENIDTFWVGGYGEFDKISSCMVKKLQKKYPAIRLILIIAYAGQLHRYSDEFPFDGFDYPPEAENAPQKFAISARNRYMAENCDIVIAYIRHDYGGAYDAVKTAKGKTKKIINLISNNSVFR